MQIKLCCPCGATFEAESTSYINGGGAPDMCGRKFVVQVAADKWQDVHKACLPEVVAQELASPMGLPFDSFSK